MKSATYTVEPQRFVPGRGYVLCEAHQSCRCIVVETKRIPRKGKRPAAQIKRTLARFDGPNRLHVAQAYCSELLRRAEKRKPLREKLRPQPLYRSLTQNEYLKTKGQ